ncbi:hypothetical protein [Bacteroides faecalis]|uniref:Uncharacterized protein n=1 Tax=Bacteroides faecalis TaxID=2447885 RepID=A0A401LRE4_9BACE|nr:hypothetical protein [Bacteroides faecalis]GCB34059.1 hypothetical protein KGMB02408_10040 [Bacteroides faecalis]
MDKTNILGCFTSSGGYEASDTDLIRKTKDKKDDLFCSYIWGEKGINNKLALLKREDYGSDMNLILFEFYVDPIPCLRQHLKEIESYRKKEKAIGIPIIITDENFFNKSEEERYEFLKVSIMQKMDLLEAVIKRRKLDTNMKQLKSDLVKLLSRLP